MMNYDIVQRNGTLIFAVIFMLVFWSVANFVNDRRYVYIPYSEFKVLVSSGNVETVRFSGDELKAELTKATDLSKYEGAKTFVKTYTPQLGDDSLLGLLEEKEIELNVISHDSDNSILSMLVGLLPFILFIGIYFWFLRGLGSRLSGGGFGQEKRITNFLQPRSQIDDAPPVTTFEDVAGQDNAKNEVRELLDYIRHPEKYQALGASVPKGVLLMGPPGTGKTLLARALAGEAGVPFCSISASEFIEMYVGVGAARVRALFNQAKEKAPSIIFIDELDAVGRARGTGLGGGNDEREQTLNQILSEMDGFAGHETVIVLAATNRPDVLDPALLRHGRFDRHVTLELPDIVAREAILKVHTRDSPLAEDVKLSEIAAETPGFSGADLKNLVNEAAMHAARNKAETITFEDFEQMRDKVIFGSTRKLVIQADERHRLAVHEAGHTAAAFFLSEADPIHKVTIIPRGQALGLTQQMPENERYTLPLPYLKHRLAVMLAGRAAEQTFLDNVSSGADDDIKQATALARAMVSRWGMSPEVGPIDLRESDEHPFLGREITTPRTHGESSANAVDAAVRKLLLEAQAQAEKVMQENATLVKKLVTKLEEKETLDRDTIIGILDVTSD